MKIFITGGAGFIGSHTADACIKAGHDVIIIDNLLTGYKENIPPQARFYNKNIFNDDILNIMENERPDIVYLFAFFVLVPKSVENPMLDMDCLVGSLKIIQKAKELGVKKIVFASSGFLYGNTQNLPAVETEVISPISPYIISKSALENYLYFYRYAFNLPYVILRYPAVYGPCQVTGAMADYIRKLAAGGQAEIWGSGEKTRDYLYITDVVNANMLALSIPDDHPAPIFNLGTGRETTLNELYSAIAGLLGKEAAPIYHPDRPGEQMRYCLDAAKINRECGWVPQVSLKDGLRMTLQSKGLLP